MIWTVCGSEFQTDAEREQSTVNNYGLLNWCPASKLAELAVSAVFLSSRRWGESPEYVSSDGRGKSLGYVVSGVGEANLREEANVRNSSKSAELDRWFHFLSFHLCISYHSRCSYKISIFSNYLIHIPGLSSRPKLLPTSNWVECKSCLSCYNNIFEPAQIGVAFVARTACTFRRHTHKSIDARTHNHAGRVYRYGVNVWILTKQTCVLSFSSSRFNTSSS